MLDIFGDALHVNWENDVGEMETLYFEDLDTNWMQKLRKALKKSIKQQKKSIKAEKVRREAALKAAIKAEK